MNSKLHAPLTRSIAALALALGWAMESQATAVSLTPSAPAIAAIGDTITLDLGITGVADLYAFNFSLQFDPGVLQLSGLTEGSALGLAGTTFFVAGAFDNVGGLLELTGNTLIGAIPGFTGNGTLATISFTAVGGGTSAVALNDVLLLDSSFGIITSSVSSATVEVAGEGTVPEPATYALVISALAAMTLARRQQAAAS